MGTLRALGRNGDTALDWTAGGTVEAAAHEMFVRMRRQGHLAFRTVNRTESEQIDAFDPAAEEILLIPQLRGG